MKLVFIAGPYGAHLPERDIQKNIGEARRAAIFLIRAGFYTLTPHLNTGNFHSIMPAVPEEHYRIMYRYILERCDLIYALPRWESSVGTRLELIHAKEHNIPIYFNLQTLIRENRNATK